MSQKIGPNQQQWFDGLLSGDYIQTKNWLETVLSNHSKYCCLGAGCRIFGIARKPPLSPGGHPRYGMNNESRNAPQDLVERLALWSPTGTRKSWLDAERAGIAGDWRMTHPKQTGSIVGYNDMGYTYAQIVEIIKAEPHEFFYESR